MAGAPPRRRDSPPVLPDELVEEIFLRLPPDEPKWLLHASLTSKAWGRAISSLAFRRRLHEVHGWPPVLGFLHDWYYDPIPLFIPTTASSFSLAAPDCQTWRALDCRHGRALFLDQGARELLVWEPITGGQRRVPVPSPFESYRSPKELYPSAAVFCAADECDHRDCQGDPFGLVFFFTNLGFEVPDDDDEEEEEFDICACVFSSETGTWGKPTSIQSKFKECTDYSSVLVGRSLLYFMSHDSMILEYDLARHNMAVFRPPGCVGRLNIMLTEDGGLGVGEYSDPNLKLWTREASDCTDARWVLSRVINLDNLLQIGAPLNAGSRVQWLGFAEGANIIFCHTIAGIFTVELRSEKVTKVFDDKADFCNLIPVVSFYTPARRVEHQDPPPMGPSEEAGGEEGGAEEKAVEQPQQLFDKGSNAIEEGNSANACFSHTLEARVPSHREVALECAIDDVPESPTNEESVTGTTSKDADNSKTSGSNVEDAALPSQKGESKEGTLYHRPFPWTSGGARAAPLCGEIHDFL